MTDRDDIREIAEIDFEVGHTSIIRDEPTTTHNPPRTHDWRVYLRSTDVSGNLNCLIKRCVFYLHQEFPNPKREFRSTPFAIQESGYGCFDLYIDIFFQTKSEPKKFRIQYDLNLHTNADGEPFRRKESYVRKYRCTFYNPDPELRQKVLQAGGKVKEIAQNSSNNNESEEDETEEEPIPVAVPEPVTRLSPPSVPKRPLSPVPNANVNSNKKVKVESTANIQKKTSPPTIKNENITKIPTNNSNNKKSQLILSNKSSPIVSTSQTNGSTDDSLNKVRSSLKIKSDPDSKSSSTMIPKKKDMVPSPSKLTVPNQLKKPLIAPPSKPSQKSSIVTKSPSNLPIKLESSPNTTSSNSTNATVLISSLKKIPKKIVPPVPPPPPPVIEKRPRSPMTPPSSASRNSDRDSHRYSSKTSKRDRPTSTTTTTTPPSTSNNNSNNGRSGSSSSRSTKHSTTSTNRGRSRSRSRSRSHNRSSHHSSSSNRSHHSSSRHSSQQQQKDRSIRHSTPPSSTHHSSLISKSSSSSSSHNNHRRVTSSSSKSIHSPSRSGGSNPPLSSSNDHSLLPSSSSSINTPQSRANSAEPVVVVSSTCSPSTHIFQSEDDHTQTPMDIDGQTDDDETHIHRPIQLSDEHEQQSPSSTAFVPQDSTTNHFSLEHSDTNESTVDSDLSLDEDDDLPSVLTDDDLRSKLIFIYNRFTSTSTDDLGTFVKFFKRHQLIDTSSLEMNKSNDGTFTYDLLSLSPYLIGELANDLGYNTTTTIMSNQTEQ